MTLARPVPGNPTEVGRPPNGPRCTPSLKGAAGASAPERAHSTASHPPSAPLRSSLTSVLCTTTRVYESERSKGGSTVARRRHRHRVLLYSTRHHSHTAAHRIGVAGPACTSPAETTSRRSTMSNGVYGPRVRRSAVESAAIGRRQRGDLPLKHDGDPLPGSPSVIPQRTHGRVGRVLWEIGTADAQTPQSSKSCDTRFAISVAILGGPPPWGRSSVG